ncbi:M28 family peptidase [Pseudochryseolinea flava]|uniref:Arginyl aminopeptidase n=1 Tax=Pseudochryseolinea flava TaxID=2059302 RepID=A0A364Y703_9BACT|nr:M28 family peptidase [Pseudochryseolinea flava]RAW02720.1 arginyl aminopeptidase [Pseudochryseolinea flava]
MNKFKMMVLAGTLTSFALQAQDPVAKKYGDQITPEDLKANLSILASDALEGRETGKRGQKMAAAFIRAHFEELGLTGPVDGSYYQPVELYTSIPGDIYIKAGQNKWANFSEVVYYGNADSGGEQTLPIVFAGRGRKEDFDQLNVEGKAVVIQIASDENFRKPLEIARERKAKIAFFYNPNRQEFDELLGQFKEYLSGGTMSVNKPEPGAAKSAGVFFLSPDATAKIFNTKIEKLTALAAEDAAKNGLKKFKPATISYKTALDVKVLKSDNVLGYMEGTDKKDELVVITAHYDHIGKKPSGEGDLINNGADDDGSGTVSVLQLAKVFAAAKKDGKGPRRSILFMTVTGEEKGLLGSDYYTQHPVFPLANTVVDLNIDMVGRRDPQHKDSAPYVYVIGSDKLSTELHNINENQNKTYTNLIFDYTYNDQNHPERLYYRSDHWNFAKNNIPIVFYFDGIHEDYHKPSDEVSKIEFDLLSKRAQAVFYTAWEVANRDARLAVDKK